jgi:hypothetical protein
MPDRKPHVALGQAIDPAAQRRAVQLRGAFGVLAIRLILMGESRAIGC